MSLDRQIEDAWKSSGFEALAARIARQPGHLKGFAAGVRSDRARIKFGWMKLLRLASETNPEVVYPLIDDFFKLLDHENKILTWGAIIVIGNLASVDTKGKIDRRLGRFLKPISGPVMITAANVIAASGKIAAAKPHLADKIARALLRVEKAKYQTAECRNIAIGHVINSLEIFIDHVSKPAPVVEFVHRQVHNPRKAVRGNAARFLKRHAKAFDEWVDDFAAHSQPLSDEAISRASIYRDR